MKKQRVFSILLVCLMALGLVLTLSSCELLEELFGGTGTVKVTNNSSYAQDSVVAVGVIEGSIGSNNVISEGQMTRGGTWTYSDLKTETTYHVAVVDSGRNIYFSSTFTVKSNETKSFSYTGTAIR